MRLINSDGQVTDARVVARDGGNAASASVGNSVLVQPIIAVLCVLIGLCLMGTAWAIHEATRASTRADLAELEVESFKNVLHSRGMPTSEHLQGEKP